MKSNSGQFKKGQVSLRKGVKLSDETKKKLSLAHIGKSTWNKGLKLSDEERKKLSEAQRGHKKPTRTLEHRKKISENNKNRIVSQETKDKLRKAFTGRKHTEQTRKKLFLIAKKGENSPLWRGGNLEIRDVIRNCFEYRLWRSDILKRDNFTCQFCGVRGGNLHVDHIKRFADILRENNIKTIQEALECEELWNINNGRTLCVECHKTTDTYLNKKKKC